MAPDALLEARGIVKSFPGVRALDGVDLSLRAGEIHALVGQNGAGKSTLIGILSGARRADSGRMTLGGAPFEPLSPRAAQGRGVATVYQEIDLVPTLSVAENLMLGREPRRFGLIRGRRLREAAARALARLQVPVDPERTLGSLPTALQQLVAIARAVDLEARVLVLDEPTASLDAAEVRSLFALLRRLRAEGLAILFVTHFLEQVEELCERVTVLRNGARVAERAVDELPRLELVALMLGRAPPPAASRAPAAAAGPEGAPPVLEAVALGRAGAVERVDLAVRPGAVLGLAGLLGSGRTETLRLLFGLDRPDRGVLRVDGAEARLRSPRDAIRRGFGFCPEDRKAQGLVPELSVEENLLLAQQGKSGWARRPSRRRRRELAGALVRALEIAAADLDAPVSRLSGGSQQKVLLARWLATRPRLLLLDEPTRGIDVGARAEIEAWIARLREEGTAVTLVSSEVEELAGLAGEVVVLRARRSTARLRGDEVEPGAILREL